MLTTLKLHANQVSASIATELYIRTVRGARHQIIANLVANRLWEAVEDQLRNALWDKFSMSKEGA